MTDTATTGPASGDRGAAAAALPGLVAGLCAEAGVPALARHLINLELTEAAARARIDQAVDIKSLGARLRARWPVITAEVTDTLATSGLGAPAARAVMFDAVAAAQSPDTRNSHLPGGDGGADHGWSAAIRHACGAVRTPPAPGARF